MLPAVRSLTTTRPEGAEFFLHWGIRWTLSGPWGTFASNYDLRCALSLPQDVERQSESAGSDPSGSCSQALLWNRGGKSAGEDAWGLLPSPGQDRLPSRQGLGQQLEAAPWAKVSVGGRRRARRLQPLQVRRARGQARSGRPRAACGPFVEDDVAARGSATTLPRLPDPGIPGSDPKKTQTQERRVRKPWTMA
ncbi:unnamed protein product [Rangifer tarandus platyrhynchus]|uniref:Uncharacterized protein n=2 Tax=Rangifer tarandus platyrhynchus TaxID=3082113 RepID=A0ACB0FJV3_RANTA|nr:unnamed protein product [Rangifer tarandus platyrhynchus]CAI9713350.1 unnamed protein product [Rangifer tarandus platyrhynchus]